MAQLKKDLIFMRMARLVSEFSKCSSRQVGAVLVQDGCMVSEGWNGSPRGSQLCQAGPEDECLRRKAGFGSGEGLELCPAVHAEANCLVQAARNGIATKGSTLYLYSAVRPCKVCVGLMINAGVERVVVLREAESYDAVAEELLRESAMTVTRCDLGNCGNLGK